VAGKELGDVLPLLNRHLLDVDVKVAVKRRAYTGKVARATRKFRMILVLNEEVGEYHSYLTNIPAGVLNGEDFASLYGARVGGRAIEELKSEYRLDEIQSANPNVVKCLVWVSILTLICSCQMLRLVRSLDRKNAHLYTHLQWAKAFMEGSHRIMEEVLKSINIELDMIAYFQIMMSQGKTPNINRERMMDK